VDAEYVFRATFRLEPADPDVSVDPGRFETVLRKRAADPGEDGWLFFRDNLWRGEVNDEAYLRERIEELLTGRSPGGERENGRGIVVERVSFGELVTDEAYLSALREAIAADLGAFRADDVEEVLHKYLGSSVRVGGPE
jgi:hypothetical protein